jgi:hypothetical protein
MKSKVCRFCIPFKTIAIGLAVGALGVFLLRKYKVI